MHILHNLVMLLLGMYPKAVLIFLDWGQTTLVGEAAFFFFFFNENRV